MRLAESINRAISIEIELHINLINSPIDDNGVKSCIDSKIFARHATKEDCAKWTQRLSRAKSLGLPPKGSHR